MSIGIRPVFEQWALEQGFSITRADDNSYSTPTTDAAWGGWVAANVPQATSPALERVIAEQQREVDIIRKYREVDAERWVKHNKRIDQFMADAIYFLNNYAHPVNGRTAQQDFRQAIMGMGWCLTCECNPCECEYD